MNKDEIQSVGLVGARGYTGRVLMRLIAQHPALDLSFALSRELAGQPVCSVAPEISNELTFESANAQAVVSRNADIIILAMPDGAAAPFVQEIENHAPDTLLLDLSADYRFDEHWQYGLPELRRLKAQGHRLNGARRIANPGCYATAMQLAIAPLLPHLNGVPSVFGVSGYSGAGTKPNPRNDTDRLANNLMPYALTGHNHEREASRHLGTPVRFTPHVHPALSGIIVTVHIPLSSSMERNQLKAVYSDAYKDEPLIKLQDDAPELKQGTNYNGVIIGGFGISQTSNHAVIVAAEDNLLKGAAVQAIQNINLATGQDEFTAIALQ